VRNAQRLLRSENRKKIFTWVKLFVHFLSSTITSVLNDILTGQSSWHNAFSMPNTLKNTVKINWKIFIKREWKFCLIQGVESPDFQVKKIQKNPKNPKKSKKIRKNPKKSKKIQKKSEKFQKNPKNPFFIYAWSHACFYATTNKKNLSNMLVMLFYETLMGFILKKIFFCFRIWIFLFNVYKQISFHSTKENFLALIFNRFLFKVFWIRSLNTADFFVFLIFSSSPTLRNRSEIGWNFFYVHQWTFLILFSNRILDTSK
jgi:hypothetical protein